MIILIIFFTVFFDRFDIVAPKSEILGTKCKGDFLRIVDGRCGESIYKPMEKLCGNEIPSSYLSSGNNLCMKFVSDQSVVGRGFALNYTSENMNKRDQKYPVQGNH